MEIESTRKKIGKVQTEYDMLQIEKADTIKEYQVCLQKYDTLVE